MLLPVLAVVLQLATRAPEAPNAGVCSPYVKWRAIVFTDTRGEPWTVATLPIEVVEFWTKVEAIDQASTTMNVANNGAFGSTYVEGYHNTAYTKTFFPASRVLESRYEFDCLR